jgi:hypothetical protein
MLMRVREHGDEVLVELTGVAGRQHRVLQALNECQRTVCTGVSSDRSASQVSVRSGANDMHIRLKAGNGTRFEASAIYRCLRHALFEARTPAPLAAAR